MLNNHNKVYKQTLSFGYQTAMLPTRATVVFFGMQNGNPTCWYSFHEGDADHLKLRKFIVIGTGVTAPEDTHYIATTMDGHYVWHLFSDYQ